MPGTYLHPGVYVEEVSGGARPIEAVGTSTAAFVGIAEKGPTDEARFVTNFTEFQQIYGGYVRDSFVGTSYLAYSVFQFFQNGGRSCYVVRVEDQATAAELTLHTEQGAKTMTVRAITPGAWGNDLRIAIGPGTTSPDAFNLYVYLKDELKETYEDASMVDSSSFYIDRLTKKSLFIRTESESLPDNPTFVGRKTELFDLSKVSQIKLMIDAFGPYVIDCAENAGDKTKVRAAEICANINKFFANDTKVAVAFDDSGRVKIVSPGADESSRIIFSNPAAKDATYDIFGLQESSWAVKGSDEAVAAVCGLATAATIHTNLATSKKISAGLGGAALSEITLAQEANATDTLFAAVNAINTALSTTVAYTDGAHVILRSNQEIRVKQSNANLVFGDGAYAYVHTGTGTNPATIQSSGPVAAVTGDIRLKIDNQPAFVVGVAAGDTAEVVAGKINAAFQKASKGKKKVADVVDTNKVALTSVEAGSSGRIIVSGHTGTDAAASVFGTAHKNMDDYVFTAETESVAKVTGTRNLSAGIGADLAGKKLRISVGDQTTQFTVSSVAADSVKKLFTTDFAGKAILNYRLLTAGTTAEMVVANVSAAAEIYFSIPLKGATEIEEAETGADTQAAYAALFGDVPPFTGSPATAPKYTYQFDCPDNRPAPTSANLALSGGNQDRTRKNRLRDLTVGADGENGLRRFDKLTDVNILVIPGWENMGDDIATYFVNEGTTYCDKIRPAQARPLRDLFFVADVPSSVTKPEDARDYVQGNVTKSSGGYTAIYYPWLSVADPIGTKSPTVSVPPAGSIAGLYASIDGRRGVWKAPAGTEAGVAGVVSLADQVNDIKQDLLNPFGVNVVRRIPGAGIVSWGTRTLATNPEWKYVPVRRIAIMMEVSIYEGIQWAVFEPNDEPLWSLLRLNINAFMMNLFRNGAFQGATPEQAFFVKCDSETTTQVDIDLGKVNILVGFAPLKPAEFVIVKISQHTAKSE